MKKLLLSTAIVASAFGAKAQLVDESIAQDLIVMAYQSSPEGCTYFQPSVSNGYISEFKTSNGGFTLVPICPRCGRENPSRLLVGGQGYTSGKVEKEGSCSNYDCKENGKTYYYKAFASWPTPKCD